MTRFISYSGVARQMTALLFGSLSLVLVLAFGGTGGAEARNPASAPVPAPPTVTAIVPSNNASGVPINNTIITAAFSEAMAPMGSGSSFTLQCAAPCINPTGTVALDAGNRIATFTLSGSALAPNTVYTATVNAARSIATGLALDSAHVWQFTTGISADTTRPRVMFTVPPTTIAGPTAAMSSTPDNAAINAIFSEDVAPATINAGSFKVSCSAPCVAPVGTVSYDVGSRTATFTPSAKLIAGAIYTVAITTAAIDLAGNALAGNQAPLPAASSYVWTFTATPSMSAANSLAKIAVLSTNPASAAAGVCPGATVNATFGPTPRASAGASAVVYSGFSMDPQTVNAANFIVTGPAPAVTSVAASSVVLDAATGRIATFTPARALTPGATYTATIKRGVKDLALPANALPEDVSWTFTAGAMTGRCLAPVALGSAQPFGSFGGSRKTSNAGLLTVVHGDIGTTAVAAAVSGFHDATAGCAYTETPFNRGVVNGKIYTAEALPALVCPGKNSAATLAIATRGRADALAAYNALAAIPAGPDPDPVAGSGNLANRVLKPGVYTAAGGSFRIQGGNLTLDAKGDANAVWIFQMANTLTVGGPGAAFPQSVILVNGAQHKNVFWQVGGDATINAAGGGTMVGTIISHGGVAFSTAGNATKLTLNGRVMSLGAAVTMANTVINVPAP